MDPWRKFDVETVTQKSRIISQGFHQTYFVKSRWLEKEMFEYPLDIAYQILCSPLHLYLNTVFKSQ
jgi:hypothetical protein